MTIDALGHFKQDNYSTMGGDGGCTVGEVRASTASPMPDHKGFKLQLLSETPDITGMLIRQWVPEQEHMVQWFHHWA